MPAQNLHKIITSVCKILFDAEDRRIQNWIDKLCKQNREFYVHPERFEGFLYEGTFYRPSWFPTGLPPTKILHTSLYEEMHKLIIGKNEIDSDRSFIKQMLFKLLYPCENDQDIRDALPECLVGVSPAHLRLPRTRPTAYTIAEDPRALKQFEKMLPQIELYMATKLLF